MEILARSLSQLSDYHLKVSTNPIEINKKNVYDSMWMKFQRTKNVITEMYFFAFQ